MKKENSLIAPNSIPFILMSGIFCAKHVTFSSFAYYNYRKSSKFADEYDVTR